MSKNQQPSAIVNGKPEYSGQNFEIYDPSLDEVINAVGIADADSVDRAVVAAVNAFGAGGWAESSVAYRQTILRSCADIIDKNRDELVRLESRNTGIPIAQLPRQVERAAYNFRFFAEYIGQQSGQIYEQNPDYLTMVRREPIGVAALIAPWNAPLALATMKIAAATAFGNCCVVKPSEIAPLGVIRMIELLHETDIPKGVVNLVNGPGDPTGEALVNHPSVDLISFTGGTETGRRIMQDAGKRLVASTMELGGKSANIIFEKCDFDRAVSGALASIFMNNGQQCLAGSRILVQRSILDKFIAAFRNRAEAIRIGDPGDTATELGPLVSSGQRDRFLRFVSEAEADGGALVTGGEAVADVRGYYVKPTAVLVKSNRDRICQEEIFGPFAAIIAFDTEAEAYAIANDSRFGLVSYVWTQDVTQAMRAQNAIKAGVVWINTSMVRELRAPFGGVRDSGIGAEGGNACARFYTSEKTVTIPVDQPRLPALGQV
ncbi:aldehyde dehydrogenase [Parasphingorhabdus sp.]|uniref:aldehyde dehydrogenase n=1 Tax=Parasphingorhabdus sp. TaxID=2709688 RepID=UPI003A8D17F4